MQHLAEFLRYVLITMQAAMVWWMIRSGLWRRLPLWTSWMAMEALSRLLFIPAGNYWHLIWLHLQPMILFLLGSAACEARFQMGRLPELNLAFALGLVPIGVSLDLAAMINFRIWACALLAAFLFCQGGTKTATWHARILMIVCAATAMMGVRPASGQAWWMMRTAYLAVYCLCMAGWFFVFSRRSVAAEIEQR